MIALAGEFFKTKNDPDQISVNKRSIAKLRRIHPATMMEERERRGPFAWMLVLPTTRDLMEKFNAGKINEKELLRKTPLTGKYDSLYLCSALVLPEYRGKGIARNLAIEAARTIMRDHPIEALFYWPFSEAGKRLANAVAEEIGLPLYRRRPARKLRAGGSKV